MPEHDDKTYLATLLEDMKSLSPEFDDWLSQHRYLEQLKSTRLDMESKRVPYELSNWDEDNYRGIVESVEEANEQLDRLQAKFETKARTVASELSHKFDSLTDDQDAQLQNLILSESVITEAGEVLEASKEIPPISATGSSPSANDQW